jgi:uncharacterized C2H2 Zn-finger protein
MRIQLNCSTGRFENRGSSGKARASVADEAEENDQAEEAFHDEEDGHNYYASEGSQWEPYNDPQDEDDDAVGYLTTPEITPIFTCHRCNNTFPSNNKMHLHVRKSHSSKPKKAGVSLTRAASLLTEAAYLQKVSTEGKLSADTFATSTTLATKAASDLPETSIPTRIIQSSFDSQNDVGTGYGSRGWGNSSRPKRLVFPSAEWLLPSRCVV